MTTVRPLIAVDWGTSSLRAALLGADGAVLDERVSDRGVLSVPADGFAGVFSELVQPWRASGARLALLSGMVGSRQGWAEAPYAACPAGFSQLQAHLRWLDGQDAPFPARVAIVPGLRCDHAGVPDVMRGEEVQVFGAMQLRGLDDGCFVLPGTHSKWVRVEAGSIQSFQTFMTGEVFGLLRKHSILARTLPVPEGDDTLDEDAFLRGVARAHEAGGLLNAAFSVRTLALFEAQPPAFLPSYLSGLVIGEELRAQAHTLRAGTAPVLVGAPTLTRRYALALRAQGLATSSLGPQATWRGLWALAQSMES